MTYNLMMADGHWLLHRAYSSAGKAPPEAQPRVVARQLLSWAFIYGLEARASHLCFAFDGPHLFRKKLYPLYKAGRATLIGPDGNVMGPEARNAAILSGAVVEEVKDPVLYEALDLSIEYLKAFNVPIVRVEGFEADDHFASAAARGSLDPQIGKVLLYTRDKDCIGGLRPRCIQVCPETGSNPRVEIPYEKASDRIQEIVGTKAKGWNTERFRAFQVLVGDEGDDIPSIVSNAAAIAMINEIWSLGYNKLSDWLNKDEDGRAFAAQHRADLIRNSKLVVMDTNALPVNSLNEFLYIPPSQPPSSVYAPGAVERWREYLTWKRVSAGSSRTLFG